MYSTDLVKSYTKCIVNPIVAGICLLSGPSRDQVYEEMVDDDADMLKYHSPSFVPAMLNMFYTLPAKLKTLIRLVKYWKGQTMTVGI